MPQAQFATASGGYNSYGSGRAVAPLVLDRQDRPTAVVAISDALALGFLHALRTRGLTAGRDLSVVGFDDISGSEAAGLTTVRQPIEEKERLVGQLLLDPDLPDRQVLLCPSNSSCGPPPGPPEHQPQKGNRHVLRSGHCRRESAPEHLRPA